ncbi:TonB-dependent receptor plug domain-containing protein [Hymenobacter elongatus]|uniref:TonB-dependent receptor n=1 Tax=Hymenobacter elongatus TaxID=877208 RepID=A0A4Z0PSF9_9BACT|nr:TonB-dependent receptor [Hymenobacter elongatus]TGE19941.1 TonB-dependent receptor [Hymenobacter elongatus]
MIGFYWQRWLRLPSLCWLFGGLTGLLAPANVCAQQSVADSARQLGQVQRLPTVRVQATVPRRFAVGSRVLTLDSAVLAQYRAGTLADVLLAQTPLYLKNYGPGQLSSISVRGTSARHTAVLWNGFNIGLPSLGESDFALFPTNGATRVDVQYGPAGAAYGTGAVGGTVLLSSPVRWGAGARGTVQTDAGSFGLRASSAEGSFSNQKVAVRAAASYRRARNDFYYDSLSADGSVRRRQPNADFQQWSLTQDATLRLGEQGELLAAVWLTDANRHIQPSIGSANTFARERDQSRRLQTGYRHVASRAEWAVRGAWFEDILNYYNGNLTSNSRVRTTQAQAEYTVNIRPALSLRTGAEAQHFAAQVDGYGKAITENRFSGFALLRYDPLATVHLTANLRQAVVLDNRIGSLGEAARSGKWAPLAPTLGAEWRVWQTPTHTLAAKASASRGYRAPTLNERYWRPGGNPNLQPESSLGYEGGVEHQWQPTTGSRVHTELTAYRQVVNNWVEWTTHPTQSYDTPQNLRQVLTQGLEASTQLAWQRQRYHLAARAAYSFTQAEKLRGYANDLNPTGRQMRYVPLHTAAFTTDQTWHSWQLTTSFTATGYRFTDNSATDFLPSYTLLNATLAHTFAVAPTWRLTVVAQGFNLTNTVYQNYAYRAMPGRSAVLSVRVAWH